jgi:hypothetical protein
MRPEEELESSATIEVRVGTTMETFIVPNCKVTPEQLRSMAAKIQQAAEELLWGRFEPLHTDEKVSLYAAAGDLEDAVGKLVELAEYLRLDKGSATARTCANRRCKKEFLTYRRDQIGCYEHIGFLDPDEVAQMSREELEAEYIGD